MRIILFLFTFLFFAQVYAGEKMNYSGRLVNSTTGAPITGTPNLRFKIYEDLVAKCTVDMTNVPLENGVFSVEIDFTSKCGASTFPQVLAAALGASKNLYIELTDLTNSPSTPYSKQSLGPVPIALYAMNAAAGSVAVDDILDIQMKGITANCTNGQVLKTDGSGGFFCGADLAGSVNSVGVTFPLVNSGTAGAPNIGMDNTLPAGTYTKVTSDSFGRVTSGSNLTATDIPLLAPNKIQGVIGNESFTADLIPELSATKITSGVLAPDRIPLITDSMLATASVGTDELINAAVTEAKIADGAVTNNKLGVGAVTVDKMSWDVFASSCSAGQVLKATAGGTFACVDEATSASASWTSNGGDVYRPSGKVGVGILPTDTLDVLGSIGLRNANSFSFYDLDSSNKISFKSPNNLSGDTSYILPATDGSSGQVLTTNSLGQLSWSTVATNTIPSGAAGGSLSGSYPNPGLGNNVITDSQVADGALSQAKISGLTTALSNKEGSITASDTSTYYRGDKTWQSLTTTAVIEGINQYFTDARAKAAAVADAIVDAVTDKAPSQNAVHDALALKQDNLIVDSTLDLSGANLKVKNQGITQTKMAGVTANCTAGQVLKTNADGSFSCADDAGAGAGTWTTDGSHVWRNSGNVGIGNVAPSDKLDVVGAIGLRGNNLFKFYDADASNFVALKSANTIANDVTWTLPDADGSTGQVLKTDGSGNLSWVSFPTSTAPSGAAGGDLSGTYPNPTITGLDAAKVASGTVSNAEFGYLDGVTSNIQTQLDNKQGINSTLTGLSNLDAINGLVVQSASHTFVKRSLTVVDATRVTITNADGVSGNPTININTTLLPSPLAGDSGKYLKTTGANTSVWSTIDGAAIDNDSIPYENLQGLGAGCLPGQVLKASAPGSLNCAWETSTASTSALWATDGTNAWRATGDVGIGTNSPTSKLQVAGGVQIGTDAVACNASKAGTLRYNATKVEYCNGSTWEAFGVSSAGLTSLNGSTKQTQTFGAPGTTGTAPAWNTDTANGIHTLNIPMASAAGVSAGLLSKAEYDGLAAKLGTTTTFTGDVSGTYNATSVDKIKGSPISLTAPASGNFLRFDGTNWVNATISALDVPALDAAKITTGVLPIARGGTNSGTALTNNKIMVSSGGAIVEGPALTNGQLLIGSTGAGPQAATLTAGTGVTITNAAGTITISAAGSGGTVTNVTGTAPISVANNTTTPSISISQANTTTNGYLSSTDWNTFNNKQGAIAAGTTAQYYRGDKTWASFADDVRTATLAGYAVGANSVLAATDTILGAFGKVQGQINAVTGLVLTPSAGDAGKYFKATGAGTATWTMISGTEIANNSISDQKLIGGGCANGQILKTNGAGGFYCAWETATASSTALWSTDGTNAWRASGNVGIGTAAPTASLTVMSDVLFNGINLGRGKGNSTTNLALGYQALQANTSGTDNTAVGNQALKMQTSGWANTALGSEALKTQAGLADENTAIGYQALALATLGYNTAVGAMSLASNTTGEANVAIGAEALNNVTTGINNTGIGFQAGNGITTGSGNTIIGKITGLAAGLTNTVIIGDGVGNQRIYIDSSGNTGLGTTSPTASLTIAGGVKIGNDSATCAAGKAGTLRYSGTSVEYCNGTAWQAFGVSGAGITSFNGSAQATQTFAVPGTTGTAPAWSTNTGTGVHTLNIPMASAAGVTAGLISKAQYDALNNKETTIAAGTTAQYYRGDKTWADFQNDVRSATLTGFSATSASITAASSIVTAFGQAQGQINALQASKQDTFTASLPLALNSNILSLTTNSITGSYLQGQPLCLAGEQLSYRLPGGFVCENASGASSGTWTLNGSDVYRASGNVGIRTATPTVALAVGGSLYTNTGPEIHLVNPTGFSTFAMGEDFNNFASVVWMDTANTLNFSTKSSGTSYNNTLVLRNGRVGIGAESMNYDLGILGSGTPRTIGVLRNTAVSPGSSLTVVAGGATAAASNVNGGDLILSSGISTGNASSNIEFKTAGGGSVGSSDNTPTTRMNITGAGNVGIGITSPQANLDVGGSIKTTKAGGGRYTGDEGILVDYLPGDRARIMQVAGGTGSTRALSFGVGDSEKMRIHSDGNIGIGTTTPGAKLEVAGQIKITGGTPGANKVLTSDASGLATWTTPVTGSDLSAGATINGIVYPASIAQTLQVPLAPVAGNDVANKTYVDSVASPWLKSGTKIYYDAGQIIAGGVGTAYTGTDDAFIVKGDAGNMARMVFDRGSSLTQMTTNGSQFVMSKCTNLSCTGSESFFSIDYTTNLINLGKSSKVTVETSGVAGAIGLLATSPIKFYDSDSSNFVALKSPATVASDLTFTLPSAYGTNGQVLTTDGAGVLSWATAGGGLPAADGTAAAPSIAFTNSLGTGLYRPAADILGISTAGAERVRIAGNGAVMIGTPPGSYSPYSVHVNNTTSSRSGMTFYHSGSGATGSDGFDLALVFSNVELNNYENGYMSFKTNNTERVKISSAGNVGIGATTPSSLLHVSGSAFYPLTLESSSAGVGLMFKEVNSSGGDEGIYATANEVRIAVGGTDRFKATSTGAEILGQVKITGGTPGAGKVLTSDAAGLASWANASASATPGGFDKSIQYNKNGVLAGASGAYWDETQGFFGLGSTPYAPLWIQTSEYRPVVILNPSLTSGGSTGILLTKMNTADTTGEISYVYNDDDTQKAIKLRHWSGGEFTLLKNGNAGVGTGSPQATLDVNGTMISKANSAAASTTIDYATGNLQYSTASCGAFTLNNMKSGGSYTLAVQGTGGGTCSFTATGLTVKPGPAVLAQTANKHMLFTFLVMGSYVYVASIDGY